MVKRPLEPSSDGPDEALDFPSAVLQLAPPSGFEEAAGEALEAVGSALKGTFGETAYVVPYGSIVQGMHLDGSDLDLCIEVPGQNLVGQAGAGGKVDNGPQVSALKRLMGKLPATFRVVETRFWKHMKVPIVILSFKSPSGSEVETDISVGAVFEGVPKGLTDRLVRRALAHSPRAMHLARLVKLWARLEKLNKAYDGFLNALGWTLMVIFFLEERGEILTSALDEEEANERGPGGDEGQLPPALHPSGDFGSREEELLGVPMGEEVAEFFEWLPLFVGSWPEDTPENVWAVSLVEGQMIQVPKPSKVWADQPSFFIEDPGIRVSKGTTENVARSLKVQPWQTTLKRCEETAAALRAEPDAADGWVHGLLQRAAAERTAKAKVAMPKAATPRAAWPQAGAPRAPVLPTGGPRPPGFPPPRAVRPVRPVGPAGAAWSQASPRPAPKAAAAWPQASPRPAPKAAAAWPQAASVAAGKGRPWPGQQPPAKRPNQGICPWFLKGECWSGERCKASHG